MTPLLLLALAVQDADQPDPIRVMSFNIRYATANDGENRWELRKDLVIGTIAKHRPHILGVQEALASQVDVLAVALPQMEVLGQGRSGGRDGEFSALLVDRERFEVESHGDFWLSPTPNQVGSQGWDAALPRMCTWAVLRDRETDELMRVLNTHFDHRGSRARLESASVLIQQAGLGDDLPLIVTGDLNAGEDSPPLSRLREEGLTDSFRAAHPEAENVGTFHGFRGRTGGNKIDYVLVDSRWQVTRAEILRDNEDGRYPSDHFPVVAELSWVEGSSRHPVGRVHYGTSSWSAKSWVGPFYPPGTAPGNFLTHYAKRYSTVEADVTYYRVPDEKLVDGWNQKTPDEFILSAKFPRSIVHGGVEAKPDPARLLVLEEVGKDLKRFLANMGRLGSKCGPLILQFPYFNRQVFPSPDPFLDRLDSFLAELPDSFRFGVEIRNRTWIGKPLLEILTKHRVALVLVDLVYMPHPAILAESMDLVTTDFLYCRLIGDRKAVEKRTDHFDKIVIDQTERLKGWNALLRKMLERVPDIYAYANNHFAGHAPATIDTLRDMVGD